MIPANTGVREAFGWTGVMAGAAIVFFAYIGFDAVSTAPQEARNPRRDMPIAIIGSLLICTFLYILVSAIATGVMPYRQLDAPDPIALVADHAGLGWMASLVKLGAIAGLSSVILVMLLGQSRIFWTMSRDGLLPPFVNQVHPRFRMRVREPDLPRAFRIPLVWVVAPFGAASALYLMVSLPWVTWLRLLVWLGIGLVLYFTYGLHRSRLARPEATVSARPVTEHRMRMYRLPAVTWTRFLLRLAAETVLSLLCGYRRSRLGFAKPGPPAAP